MCEVLCKPCVEQDLPYLPRERSSKHPMIPVCRDEREEVLLRCLVCVDLVHIVFAFGGLEGVLQERFSITDSVFEYAADAKGSCFLVEESSEICLITNKSVCIPRIRRSLDCFRLEVNDGELVLVVSEGYSWHHAKVFFFDRHTLTLKKAVRLSCVGLLLPSGIHIQQSRVLIVFKGVVCVFDRNYKLIETQGFKKPPTNWYSYGESYYIEHSGSKLYQLIHARDADSNQVQCTEIPLHNVPRQATGYRYLVADGDYLHLFDFGYCGLSTGTSIVELSRDKVKSGSYVAKWNRDCPSCITESRILEVRMVKSLLHLVCPHAVSIYR
jgi:hypothetical protein